MWITRFASFFFVRLGFLLILISLFCVPLYRRNITPEGMHDGPTLFFGLLDKLARSYLSMPTVDTLTAGIRGTIIEHKLSDIQKRLPPYLTMRTWEILAAGVSLALIGSLLAFLLPRRLLPTPLAMVGAGAACIYSFWSSGEEKACSLQIGFFFIVVGVIVQLVECSGGAEKLPNPRRCLITGFVQSTPAVFPSQAS